MASKEEKKEAKLLSTEKNLVFSLSGWQSYDPSPDAHFGPRLLRGQLIVEEEAPRDTYFDYDCSPECSKWLHGALFINGFNVGRYHQVGPQKTLYIPGPLLKKGNNEVVFLKDHNLCPVHFLC